MAESEVFTAGGDDKRRGNIGGVYEIGEAVAELHFVKAAFKSVTFLFKLASGEKSKDHAKNRYKFLNLVEQKANPHASWLTLPAFGKLA